MFDHIKYECPAVQVKCETCGKEMTRAEYKNHECLKVKLMKRLRACKVDVNEYLAEHMMRLRRSKETLGLCMKIQCVERFKASNQYKAG